MRIVGLSGPLLLHIIYSGRVLDWLAGKVGVKSIFFQFSLAMDKLPADAMQKVLQFVGIKDCVGLAQTNKQLRNDVHKQASHYSQRYGSTPSTRSGDTKVVVYT